MDKKTLFNPWIPIHLVVVGLVILSMGLILESQKCGEITPEAVSIEKHD